MSKRQRRKREKVRRHEPHERPDRLARRLATGAGVSVGATLLMGGVAQATDFTVDNLNDTGGSCPTTSTCTLRQAINDGNTNSGPDTIVFRSGLTGAITLTSGQLEITDPLTVQGPGANLITVSGNHASRAFYVDGAAATISGLTITAGDLGYASGGGIYGFNADLTVSDSVVTENHATWGGGAAAGGAGSLTITSSTISGNTISGSTFSGGGGVYTASGTGVPTTIRSSTISGNSGAINGGGVYFDYSAPATVENSTIYDNHATEGGGLYHFGAYDGAPGLTVTGSTITHNTADRGGGIACFGATFLTHDLTEPILRNTIVSGNNAASADQGNDVSCDRVNSVNPGTVQAAFSLLGSVDPGTTIEQTPPGSDIFGQDPQLGPLANNGDPTQTQAPSATSPVLDKGNSFDLGSDQRGVVRPIDFPAFPNAGDGSDIGAVELQPSNAFKLGKLKRNKKKGTAKQVVILPLPDAGSVTIKGKGLKTKTRKVTGAPKLKLPVIAKGKKHKALNRSGKAKIKTKLIYNATGNAASMLKKKLKLLKLIG